MVNALLKSLNVAEKHGGVGAEANFMSCTGDLEPHAAADFVVANNAADSRMENFSAAAGQGADTRLLHFDQRVADRKLRKARVVVDLDHGKSFEVHVGKTLVEAADQVEVVVEREIGMKAADDVKLSSAFGDAFRGARENLFESERVCAW